MDEIKTSNAQNMQQPKSGEEKQASQERRKLPRLWQPLGTNRGSVW